ncbi:MAG: hypothetical protein M0Q92_00605 [Methanoregula sp.]|nr:hypothetical protein [Methanoregula sp.]
MVSVAIIVFVATIGVVNYRNTGKSSAMQLEAYKVAGDLQKARSMALGALEFNGAVPYAWGAYFNIASPGQYLLFADINNDKIYNTGDGVLATIALQNNITLNISGVINIAFVPPDPATYLNGVNSGTASINLKDETGKTKIILVNYLGLIDVSD